MFFERIHNIFNWGDKLTRYNGETITYDEIGNPLSYRDGMEMSWLNGRKLTTLQSGNDSISYKYDSNGVRTSKTVNGVEYTYEYLNGQLMHETRGEKVFDYCYDANGQLYAVSYKANSSTDAVTYYFAHNWRGDITSIYDAGGNVVAKYEYDDWGNVLTVTDANNKSITDKNHIANLNPFRYRSYYYDSESGLYYLMSRYYDPVVHRFINADDRIDTNNSILGSNLFAYCNNNPIIYYDPNGHSFLIAIGIVIVSALVAVICTANSNTKTNTNELPIKGRPNSTSSRYDNNGNLRKERSYDNQGRAKTDTDYGHADHHPDLESPHYHDWDWSSGSPKRGEARNTVIAVCVIVACAVAIVYLAANDITGIGITDDLVIPVLAYEIYNQIIYLMA